MDRWLMALLNTLLWLSSFGGAFVLHAWIRWREDRWMRQPLFAPISDAAWDRLRAPVVWRLHPDTGPMPYLRPGAPRPAGEVVAIGPDPRDERVVPFRRGRPAR